MNKILDFKMSYSIAPLSFEKGALINDVSETSLVLLVERLIKREIV